MKRLVAGDERVVGIVKKRKFSADGPLRLSVFVVALEAGDRVLLHNTLTCQIYALSRAEWASVQVGNLSCPQVRELAEFRFLVEPDYDETAQYSRVLAVMRAMQKRSGFRSYTILPTTGCNARCIYCYEENWPVKTMTPEMADAVSDFICRTKQKGKIKLQWFGGEPLCAPTIISRICRTLRDRGVEFHSSCITNGALLTPELLQEALGLWRLTDVQVSMDGAREDYEVRKRYVRPDLHNYDRVMDAVVMLADAGLDVVIRCNYDEENLPRLNDYLKDCQARFAGRKKVTIFFEQLLPIYDLERETARHCNIETVLDRAEAMGLNVISNVLSTHLKTSSCIADPYGRAVVIDPLGGLHACDNRAFEAPLGTIFDGIIAPWLDPGDRIAEECRRCPFLPTCTPFRKLCCPVDSPGCRVRRELLTRRALLALLDKDAEGKGAEQESADGCP